MKNEEKDSVKKGKRAKGKSGRFSENALSKFRTQASLPENASWCDNSNHGVSKKLLCHSKRPLSKLEKYFGRFVTCCLYQMYSLVSNFPDENVPHCMWGICSLQ